MIAMERIRSFVKGFWDYWQQKSHYNLIDNPRWVGAWSILILICLLAATSALLFVKQIEQCQLPERFLILLFCYGWIGPWLGIMGGRILFAVWQYSESKGAVR